MKQEQKAKENELKKLVWMLVTEYVRYEPMTSIAIKSRMYYAISISAAVDPNNSKTNISYKICVGLFANIQ